MWMVLVLMLLIDELVLLTLQHAHRWLKLPSRFSPRKGMLVARLDVVDVWRRWVLRDGIEASELVIVGGKQSFGYWALPRLLRLL